MSPILCVVPVGLWSGVERERERGFDVPYLAPIESVYLPLSCSSLCSATFDMRMTWRLQVKDRCMDYMDVISSSLL